jgi:hypothetical protein
MKNGRLITNFVENAILPGRKHGDHKRSRRNFVSYDELLKGCRGSDDFYGHGGLIRKSS